MGNNPSAFKRPKNPVDSVSWDDCQAFLKGLDERVRRGKFTLPSEAEWEYACRAGSKGEFRFGHGRKQLGRYAWYEDNSEERTHSVGERKPNGWRLFDMHGNVWEWCEDVWHDGYQGAPTDGSAWTQGGDQEGFRVVRGGSWSGDPAYCRSAARGMAGATGEAYILGCRVVLRGF